MSISSTRLVEDNGEDETIEVCIRCDQDFDRCRCLSKNLIELNPETEEEVEDEIEPRRRIVE